MKKKSSMKLIGLAIISSLLFAATGCKKDNNGHDHQHCEH